MKDHHGNVWLAPAPPPAVLRTMNVLTRPVLKSPLGRRLVGLMLLEFRGRRTGRAISVPVNFNLVDDVPMAFTHAAWRHNFTGGAPVTVTHRGKAYETSGTLVPVGAGRWQPPCGSHWTPKDRLNAWESRPPAITTPQLPSSPRCVLPLGPAWSPSTSGPPQPLTDPARGPTTERQRARHIRAAASRKSTHPDRGSRHNGHAAARLPPSTELAAPPPSGGTAPGPGLGFRGRVERLTGRCPWVQRGVRRAEDVRPGAAPRVHGVALQAAHAVRWRPTAWRTATARKPTGTHTPSSLHGWRKPMSQLRSATSGASRPSRCVAAVQPNLADPPLGEDLPGG